MWETQTKFDKTASIHECAINFTVITTTYLIPNIGENFEPYANASQSYMAANVSVCSLFSV